MPLRSSQLCPLVMAIGSLLLVPGLVQGETHTTTSSLLKAENTARLGVTGYMAGAMEMGIQEFPPSTRQGPDCVGASHNIGVSLARAGTISGAVSAGAQLPSMAPHQASLKYPISAVVAYNYGVTLFREGKVSEAREQWTTAKTIYHPFPEAHYALGLSFLLEEEPLRAIEPLQMAHRWAPTWVGASQVLGLAYFEANDYEMAQQVWERAIRRTPDHAPIQANLGLLALRQGNFQASIKFSRQALILEQDLVAAHFNLGLAQLLKGDALSSIKPFQAALFFDPKLTKARISLGVAWSRLGNWALASQVWQEALRGDSVHSEAAWAHYNLGLAYLNMGDWTAATKQFRWIVNHWPEWAQGWSQLGMALVAKRDWEHAERALESAMRLKPSWAHLQVALGRVYLELGKLSQAEYAFLGATEGIPDFSEAHYLLGVVRRAQNRPGEAVGPLRKAAWQGHREAQGLLASMYAQGQGMDPNLPLAMVWWARSSREGIPDDLTNASKEQLSLLRTGLHRGQISIDRRQDVLTGFALIRQDLQGWSPIAGSHQELTLLIEKALAFDATARSLLRERVVEQSSAYPESAPKIHDYFLQTAKEGDAESCEVVRIARWVSSRGTNNLCVLMKKP